MNINRHNYEEYFILYMDNELSAAGRAEVEEFVNNHPDLKEELDTLLQFKLVPDTRVVFPGKEQLLKGEPSMVNMANYGEWLLLYIDNELSPADRSTVEQFVTENPGAAVELERLQNARLKPETIVFAHKNSLYRREERRIPAYRRLLAAAVILLALGLSVFLFLNRNDGPAKDSITNNNHSNREELIPTQKNEIIVPNKKQETEVATETATGTITKREKESVQKKETPGQPVIVSNQKTINEKKAENIPVENPQDKKRPDLVTNNNLPKPVNDIQPKNVVAINKQPDRELAVEKPLTKNDVTSADPDPSHIVQATFNPAEKNFEREEDEGKKNKLRGLFRKITRTFEKRTNIDPATEDNKLLLAGLSINLK